MNNDKSYQRLFQRMHFGEDGIGLLAMPFLTLLFLFGTVAYAMYLDTGGFNPLGILSLFTALFVFVKVCCLVMVEDFKREIHEGFCLGALKTITGIGLIWSASYLSANTHAHDLEVSFWILLSVFFIESGIRNICHSVFLMRRNKRQEQEAENEQNEQKELAEETTTWWERVEAERQSKAAIEKDLLSDLDSYLSET